MNKQKWIIIVVCIFIVLLSSTVIIYNSDHNKIERRYNIDLPSSSDVVYYYENTGWFGDGASIATVKIDTNELNDVYQSLYTGKPNLLTDEQLEEEIITNLNTFLSSSSNEYWPEWDNNIKIIDKNGSYYIFDFDLNILVMVKVIM